MKDWFETLRIRAIIHNLPYGITVQDKKGNLVYLNHAAARLMGYASSDRVMRLASNDLLSKFVMTDANNNAFPVNELPGRKALVTGQMQSEIIRFRKLRSKKEFWTYVVAMPIKNALHKTTGVINTLMDFTSYEQNRLIYEQVAERENTLRLALDVGNMGIWDWDIPNDVFRWSDGQKPTYSLDHADKQGTFKQFLDHIHPDDRTSVRKGILQAKANRGKYEGEFRIPVPRQGIHWMYKKGEVLNDGKGNPVRMIGVGLDITKRKANELMLLETKQKFQAIFDSAADAMIIADTKLRILEANSAALSLFSRPENAIVGILLTTLVERDAEKEFKRQWKQALHMGSLQNELLTTNIHGKRLTLEYSVRTKFLPNQHLFIIRDITKRIDENRRREHLLGLASHELRTPLASIKAFIEITKRLIKKSGDSATGSYLSKIDEKVDAVTRLTNDLLDIARIRDNRLELFYETFAFRPFMEDVVTDMQLTVPTHRLILQCKTDVDITGDKLRIEQVLINVIKNAVRYSPKADKVIIRVRKKSDNVIISVQDFGVGIAQKEYKHIFQMFYKIDAQTGKRIYGIGVGLYIAQTIVVSHGGKIWVESKPGKGSIFYISLPVSHTPSI